MARKRESRRHHVLLWVLAKGAVLIKWQMLEVLSFRILQSGEALTFSNINNPVTFSCEKKKEQWSSPGFFLKIIATKLWANSRPRI